MKKISKYTMLSIGIIAIGIYIASMFGALSFDDLFTYMFPKMVGLIALALILMLIFMFKEWFAPNTIKKTLIVLGFLTLILIIAFSIADNDTLETGVSVRVAKATSMGIWTLFLILIIAIASVAWSEIRKLIS